MRWSFLFVAITIAVALGACADILGIDDVGVRDGGNAGDSGISDGSAIDGDSDTIVEPGPCVPCTADDNGPCAIACNQSTPNGIAVDEQNSIVYWITKGEGTDTGPNGDAGFDGGGVWRAPLVGVGSPTLIENEFAKRPSGLSYSHTTGVAAYSLGYANTIRVTDGGVDASAPAVTDTGSPGPITVTMSQDGTTIFYICGGPPGTLYSRQLASSSSTSIGNPNSVNSVTSRQNVVDWTTGTGDVTESASFIGTPNASVANRGTTTGVIEISPDKQLVAWGVSSSASGTASVQVASNGAGSTGFPAWFGRSVSGLRFEADRYALYIVDHDDGKIFSVQVTSTTSASQVTIASAQDHPLAIDVSPTWIVWTNAGHGNASGSIMRMRIP